ncbi:hypothetical protein HDU86_005555 [Geranomyces michiganensis]|nr:hypothetical protein HDU86_005555 [Geranomyces michiganensis]
MVHSMVSRAEPIPPRNIGRSWNSKEILEVDPRLGFFSYTPPVVGNKNLLASPIIGSVAHSEYVPKWQTPNNMDSTPLAQSEDPERGNRLQIDEKRQLFRGQNGISWTVRLSFALPTLLALMYVTAEAVGRWFLSIKPRFPNSFSLIGIAVTLIWVSSLNTFQEYSVGSAEGTIGGLATGLLTSTGNRIDTSIEDFLADKVKIVTLVDTMQKANLLRPESLDEYYQTFYSTVKANPLLSGVAYADAEQMTYIGFARNDDGTFHYELRLAPPYVCHICNRTSTPTGQKAYINVAQDGTIGTQYKSKDYDFHARDWWKNATRTNTTIWTDPYVFSNGQVGISVVKLVYSKVNPGAIAGAFVSDISLDPLSQFLKTMVSGEGGFASLVTPYNELLASSTDQPLKKDGPTPSSDPVLIPALDAQDSFTKQTMKFVIHGHSAGITNATIKDTNYWFSYRTFKSSSPDIPDFGCTSIVGRDSAQYTAPVKDLVTNFDDSRVKAVRNSALITMASILAGFLLIVAFVFLILLRPLKELQTSMLKRIPLNRD